MTEDKKKTRVLYKKPNQDILCVFFLIYLFIYLFFFLSEIKKRKV